ncbi:MAG: universal stress protein [Syntrophomonadaceae bacterium]|nr:universal stress protein [Syntrophomonadaceae bacterium]
MFKRVLVPVDGSGLAARVLRYVKKLMLENMIERVEVLHIRPRLGDSYGSALERRIQVLSELESKKVISEARQIFAEDNLKVETTILSGEPADAILNFAVEKNCDLIVMGNQGLSTIGQLFLGDTYNKVVRLAPVPVVSIGRYAVVD